PGTAVEAGIGLLQPPGTHVIQHSAAVAAVSFSSIKFPTTGNLFIYLTLEEHYGFCNHRELYQMQIHRLR
ncbi:MAG: hypothetical protein KGZ69_10835, partial [Methylomonas sp.]|nr:hypothetical protein [Methylomonas sp.]